MTKTRFGLTCNRQAVLNFSIPRKLLIQFLYFLTQAVRRTQLLKLLKNSESVTFLKSISNNRSKLEQTLPPQ